MGRPRATLTHPHTHAEKERGQLPAGQAEHKRIAALVEEALTLVGVAQLALQTSLIVSLPPHSTSPTQREDTGQQLTAFRWP